MIHVGIAGIGFMGMTHYNAYQKIRGVKVAALCEQDPKRLAGDWRTIKGNFGPQGQIMDLGGIARYADLDEMLADPKLDLDRRLPAAGLARQGDHRRPSRRQARLLREADRAQSGRRHPHGAGGPAGGQAPDDRPRAALLPRVSLRLRGDPERQVRPDCSAGISNGSSPIPTWLPDFYNPQKVGGPMLDLHVHDAHFIRLVCGMPRAVQSVGTMRGEVVERFTTQFLYDPPRIVTATSGVIDQQGRPFTHGYEIYLEGATLFFDYMAIPEAGRRGNAADGAVEQRQGAAAEIGRRRSG